MNLQLTLTEPDALAELARYSTAAEQQRIALVALNLGQQALRHARGEAVSRPARRTTASSRLSSAW